METEQLTRLTDRIYKNLLDKFNPGARQMISAGKAYLKALHGASAASEQYVETITKLAKQAQQGTWADALDIGAALMQVAEVYKEIQAQQNNIMKAFYVDLLVPLETNLEKDTKVVQAEQKKFFQQHKARAETYAKAAANMKKNRKKGGKGGTKTADKELKNMQILEEEKSKLGNFCEQSLKDAMTQHRRRYGFVLERQCSLAKHYVAHFNAGLESYRVRLDDWQAIASKREHLPKCSEMLFEAMVEKIRTWKKAEDRAGRAAAEERAGRAAAEESAGRAGAEEESAGRAAVDDDSVSISSQLRKTKSMDASCLDLRSITEGSSAPSLSRAKSVFNLQSLHSSSPSLEEEEDSSPRRPKSMAVAEKPVWGEASLARAMYAYLSSGENQLSFLENDIIMLLGDRKKGWQFGENLRTQSSGWFPLAYTEAITEDTDVGSPSRRKLDVLRTHMTESQKAVSSDGATAAKPPATTMFGDTLLHRKLKKQNAEKTPLVTCLGPPPALPAPIPDLHRHFPPAPTAAPPAAPIAGPSTAPIAGPSAGPIAGPSAGPIAGPSTGPSAGPSAGPTPARPAARPTALPSALPTARPATRPNPYPASLPSLPILHLHLPTNRPNPAPGSLHSSDDSGFSNDPPPQPDIDYSDDDSARVQKAAPAETSAPADAGRKELFSSVRGWLLYKSALELWDDVSEQKGAKPSIGRTLSTRQTERSGGTLGRFSSHDLLKPSPIAVGPPADCSSSGRISVKRTKSLWKFRRANKGEILQGMALWKHRSLIDVRVGGEGGRGPGGAEEVYASAESLRKAREGREGGSDGEGEDGGVDDSSESIIVVNDHVNLGKKKGRSRYNVSSQSDITQSDTLVQKEGRSETSNSRSDLSEQTETETIGKESYLPRMKLVKSISSETWNHHLDTRPPGPNDFHTWNPSLHANGSTKAPHDKRTSKRRPHKEKPHNKLKDAPKLLKDPLRLSDLNATCGPWHDLWALDAPVQT